MNVWINKILRKGVVFMKKKLWSYLLTGVLCVSLISGTVYTVYAEETAGRRTNIRSSGALHYQPESDTSESVYIDTNDLLKLADEIDNLEYTYKSKILQKLNTIGTFFDNNGNYTHKNSNTKDPNSLRFDQLMDGILNSQTVDTNTTANNLSLGKGAWINGKYIVGNGHDVDESYTKGFDAGVSQTKKAARIEYAYHKHEGNSAEGGGCYVWKNTSENAIYCTHLWVGTSYVSGMFESYYPGYTATYSQCPMKLGNENVPVTVTSDITPGISTGTRGTDIVIYSEYYDYDHWPKESVTHKIVITPAFSGYTLDCGKTEETIIGATIVW